MEDRVNENLRKKVKRKSVQGSSGVKMTTSKQNDRGRLLSEKERRGGGGRGRGSSQTYLNYSGETEVISLKATYKREIYKESHRPRGKSRFTSY